MRFAHRTHVANTLLAFMIPIATSFLGCNSGDSSKPGQKSEMELVAEQLEQEKSSEPVESKSTLQAAPTKPDGERDYEAYLLAKYREGITPENNAAVLFWQAMWPSDIPPEEGEAIARELGLEQVPSTDHSLKELHDKSNLQSVIDYLRQNGQANPTDKEVFSFLIYAQTRPWPGNQVPSLAKWVRENKLPFDMLVEATKRPRFYSPSPSLLNNVDESLVEMQLPGCRAANQGARGLATRAMWHLGENRPDEAWSDIMAIYLLARLVGQGHTLLEKSTSFGIDKIALYPTLSYFDGQGITNEQFRKAERDLLKLSFYSDIYQSYDIFERAVIEDNFARSRLNKEGEWLQILGFNDQIMSLVRIPADQRLVQEDCNDFYDRIVKAARMPTGPLRQRAFKKINADVGQMVFYVKFNSETILKADLRERSKFVASTLITLHAPVSDTALLAQDRANTLLTLSRLAASLAVYRSRFGTYPDSLEALVPGVIAKLPVDCFHQKPFIYKPTKDGYTLYSFGSNGQDDGGRGNEDAEHGSTAKDADDIAIQLPVFQ